MTDTRRRVKVYTLNEDRQWDDRGTGHVSSGYVERLKGTSLLVRAESDGELYANLFLQNEETPLSIPFHTDLLYAHTRIFIYRYIHWDLIINYSHFAFCSSAVWVIVNADAQL